MLQIDTQTLSKAFAELKDSVIRLFFAAGGLEVGVSGFSLGAKFSDPALYFAGGVGFLAFAGLVGLTAINAALVIREVRA